MIRVSLLELDNDKFIFFPEENFLTISYIIDDDVVVFPSSKTSILSI